MFLANCPDHWILFAMLAVEGELNLILLRLLFNQPHNHVLLNAKDEAGMEYNKNFLNRFIG